MNTRDLDIWGLVMLKYPKIDNERTCRIEREFRDLARKAYYQKLYEKKILAAGNETATEAAAQVPTVS